MATDRPVPTFNVRFVGPPGLAPYKVPVRAVSAALSAVQDLASGRDPLETTKVPEEKVIGLIGVSKGSAVYRCVSRAPDEARHNLKIVGRFLSEDSENEGTDASVVRALK